MTTPERISQKSKIGNEIPLTDRNLIQSELIKEFCRIMEISDPQEMQVCAIDWIGKYADNIDQLDTHLTKEYLRLVESGASQELRLNALKKIQNQLAELDKLYG
ncbi:MAG: hypothetical protein A2750_03150 [Candidatus Yanofskybacteria bacterium RIFCSPHIGHO2_01_FULL_45_42]|uniref:Uncharacterized protein n=3 Tax=Candidatus Yanofskyibacteriota TaxID=1752733 RepID=A0A1F8F2B4_9BACT|nr:MAG: hypothetical protein A2750_03150 [Candidatus Yanofskybacteria bacterium RIFCSPHIGHO2_01_FULL_45_42]OGN16452.1 MAG: hypothetical protein A3C81_00600 [Candidatus Yanofskybacteria bacterium RIFCSPHIGHO2_02_FULL_46_19]OGN27359.1 MAG: hypothetical protein A3B17_00130 [Candidatus Yanofskybacteria bacterium RIFCSPLOWO2_01_FULL_45_72]OGN31680.1 MAG: hypothetical protein A3J01_02155 [Candidatus Yanofskybacteria bacterium RIFCSPLOWO2_02_FULL_45_18]